MNLLNPHECSMNFHNYDGMSNYELLRVLYGEFRKKNELKRGKIKMDDRCHDEENGAKFSRFKLHMSGAMVAMDFEWVYPRTVETTELMGHWIISQSE